LEDWKSSWNSLPFGFFGQFGFQLGAPCYFFVLKVFTLGIFFPLKENFKENFMNFFLAFGWKVVHFWFFLFGEKSLGKLGPFGMGVV